MSARQIFEDAPGEELLTERAVEPFDLAGRLRPARGREQTGRGSISDRRSRGRGWEARWYTIEADGRQQHTARFDRKRDAENFLNGLGTRKTWGDPRSAGQTSFKAVADSWLTTLDVKLKTRAGYESILKEHLIPAFGHRAIGGIQPSEVREFLVSLNGRSPGTKRNIIRVLNPIMKQALGDGEIAANPVSGVKLPRTPRKDDGSFLDDRQVQQLADEVGVEHRALILTAAYTGLRAGELAALRVRDLDLLHRRLTVRASVSDVNGILHLVPPKNGRTRSLSVPEFLAGILAEHQAGKRREEFVFGGVKPMRHGNFYRRRFKPAVERLVESGRWPEELAGLRFHDLRHTAASLLIKNGEHPKAVQERLGHSSITITMDRYGHLYEGHGDRRSARQGVPGVPEVDSMMEDGQLRAALARLEPDARDQLRRLLVRDQADRDHIAQQALRKRADGLADIIDMLTLDDEMRRRTVRVLGELQASS